jgi:ribosome-binding factor A
MMVSKARARRIADSIAQELAKLLQREVTDPRLEMLTVTGVDVDRELDYATVYVTATGDPERKEEVLKALDGARGYIRHALSDRFQLRSFPQLRFRWDASQEHGARIDELLDQIKSERSGGEGGASEG